MGNNKREEITGEYKREKYAAPLEVIYVITLIFQVPLISIATHIVYVFFFYLRSGKSISLLIGRCLLMLLVLFII